MHKNKYISEWMNEWMNEWMYMMNEWTNVSKTAQIIICKIIRVFTFFCDCKFATIPVTLTGVYACTYNDAFQIGSVFRVNLLGKFWLKTSRKLWVKQVGEEKRKERKWKKNVSCTGPIHLIINEDTSNW